MIKKSTKFEYRSRETRDRNNSEIQNLNDRNRENVGARCGAPGFEFGVLLI